MKKLIFAVVTILALAACKKDKIEAHGKVDKVEPTSISFVTSSFSLEEGEERSLSIKAEPDWSKKPVVSVQDESKETAVEISSSDPSVVNVADFTITAVSAGTATVTARLKKNPAVYCSCSVTVREYIKAVTLTGITLSKNSLELSDLGSDGKGESEEITVTLQPSDAGWSDVTVYSGDDRVSVEKGSMKDGQGKLTLRVASNTAHKPTGSTPAAITIRAKKGGVSKTVSVKVCGHIYGISVPVIEQMKAQGDWRLDSDGKTILYVRGNSLSIVPEIAKTGDLRTGSASGTVSLVSENPSDIAVASNGALSIPSSASVKGNSSTYYLKVTTTAAGISDIRIPVKTFEAPTSFSFKLNGNVCSGGERVYVGDSYRVNIIPQPQNALCIVKLSGSHSELTDLSLDNLYSSAMVAFNAGSPARYSSSITVRTPVNSTTATWNFYIDNYKETEVKPGDYVYFNGTNYYFSDGGLRAFKEGEWARQDSAIPKDASTLIGIVYDMTDNSSLTGLKLSGVLKYGTSEVGQYNKKTAHPAFISIKDPKAGTYTWEWCSSDGYMDIVMDSNWPTTPSGANPKGQGAYLTYQVYQALRNWNTKVSSAEKRVKAIYSVDNYNDYAGMNENQGISGSLPLKKATSSVKGSTGWMIPLANDIDKLAPFIGVVNTSISKAKSSNSSCADALSGPYWLANYSLTVVQDVNKWVYAYAFVPMASSGNYVQEREKATNKLNVRPVAFL